MKANKKISVETLATSTIWVLETKEECDEVKCEIAILIDKKCATDPNVLALGLFDLYGNDLTYILGKDEFGSYEGLHKGFKKHLKGKVNKKSYRVKYIFGNMYNFIEFIVKAYDKDMFGLRTFLLNYGLVKETVKKRKKK